METYTLGSFVVELVDDPERSLDEKIKEKYIRESIPSARKAYRNEKITEYDIIIHAINVSTGVYIKDANDTLIGFSTCVPETAEDFLVTHLKGTVMSPEYQGHGIYGILTSLRILREAEKHTHGNLLVGTRTQSPIVFRMMTEKLGLYPNINENIPNAYKSVAETYARIIRDKHSEFKSVKGLEFDPETFIISRAYGAVDEKGREYGFSMYGEKIPWLKDNDKINNYIKEHLDIQNGDAFLLLGPFDRIKAFNLLEESVRSMNIVESALMKRFAE